MKRRTKILLLVLGLPVAVVAAGYAVYRLLPARQDQPASFRVEPPPGGWVPDASMKVLTLNIAHGRRLATHQSFCKRETIEANLQGIAVVLERERPDVVALQEAEGPSFWSGNFDHVARLAELAGLEHHFRGEHVSRGVGDKRVSYGAALLAGTELGEPTSCKFKVTRPTPTKGFVFATVAFPGTDLKVDVVSVHLDFARGSKRREQVELLAAKLAGRGRPLVVMGDFNCGWSGKEDSLRLLGEKLGVRPFRPEAEGLLTFESNRPRRRLDWILISPELDFETYATLPDQVSDHLGVAATLRVRKK